MVTSQYSSQNQGPSWCAYSRLIIHLIRKIFILGTELFNAFMGTKRTSIMTDRGRIVPKCRSMPTLVPVRGEITDTAARAPERYADPFGDGPKPGLKLANSSLRSSNIGKLLNAPAPARLVPKGSSAAFQAPPPPSEISCRVIAFGMNHLNIAIY